MHDLGLYYSNRGDSVNTKKYYMESIALGEIDSMYNYGKYCYEHGNITEGLKYIKMAKDKGQKNALTFTPSPQYNVVCLDNNKNRKNNCC